MQYYPQHYFGFAVDSTIAEKLQLTEAFDSYEMTYDEDGFFVSYHDMIWIEKPVKY